MRGLSVNFNFAGCEVIIEGVLFLCQSSQVACLVTNGVRFLPLLVGFFKNLSLSRSPIFFKDSVITSISSFSFKLRSFM